MLVNSSSVQVIALPPEFIVPQDGWKKQDCERTVVKRWLAEQHTHFGEGKITYLGDDLYANQPLCQLITETYHQPFFFLQARLAHQLIRVNCCPGAKRGR